MRKILTITIALGALIAAQVSYAQEVKTKDVEGFGGVIAKKYSDSKEWWAAEQLPNKDAPNVIIFLLDDVGFAQVGSFGGLIKTEIYDSRPHFSTAVLTIACIIDGWTQSSLDWPG